MLNSWAGAVLAAILALVTPITAAAEDGERSPGKFRDPLDGALDISSFLLTPAGFMPLPIVITEPAVGYGGGVALAFFHADKEAYAKRELGGDEQFGPQPSISVGLGAYTENGTWLAGGGHLGVWKEDSIRYTGFVGVANANLKFYVFDHPLGFNLEAGFLVQDIKFRLGASDAFLGIGYLFLDSSSTFDLPGNPGNISDKDLDSRDAGLSAEFYWDSRDNSFTPNTGVEGELKLSRHDTAVGGDFDYWRSTAKVRSFHQLHERFVLGVRGDIDYTTEEAPFYALPFVSLRGIPAMRYQDQWAAAAEAEGRWNFVGRWSLVGFAGKGWTGGESLTRDTNDNIIAGGVGFRYLISRIFGIHAGVDVARGPEDTAFYLQVGSAWH